MRSERSRSARRWRVGLRARTATALAIGGFVVAVTLCVLSYELARHYLVDKRLDLVRREAVLNARFVDEAAASDPDALAEVLADISDSASPAVVERNGELYGAVVGFGEASLPPSLMAEAGSGTAGMQLTRRNGELVAMVGIPLPSAGAILYQAFPLVELEATLAAIRNSLAIGAAFTTVGAALLGLGVSRRVMRPLRRVAETAEQITDGDLSARLGDQDDPDLEPLTRAFDEMTDALQVRIERERRFAADVSHELRTPLTVLNSAVHVVQRRVGELSGPGREAVEVLGAQVDRFTGLVLEILELSRLESDLADVNLQDVDVDAALRAIAEECGLDPAVIDVGSDGPTCVRSDPRRLRVIVRNLVENANFYGGGCTRLGVVHGDRSWSIEVDDDGPGIPEDRRDVLFERFHRGLAPTDPAGSGLGLALVAENVRVMDGAVTIEDVPSGGARFVVRFPTAAAVTSVVGALAAGEGR